MASKMNEKKIDRFVLEIQDVVNVSIRAPDVEFPRCPRDGGLIHRFAKFTFDNKLYGAGLAGHSGGGTYSGAYYPEEAKKVIAWLKAQPELQDARDVDMQSWQCPCDPLTSKEELAKTECRCGKHYLCPDGEHWDGDCDKDEE